MDISNIQGGLGQSLPLDKDNSIDTLIQSPKTTPSSQQKPSIEKTLAQQFKDVAAGIQSDEPAQDIAELSSIDLSQIADDTPQVQASIVDQKQMQTKQQIASADTQPDISIMDDAETLLQPDSQERKLEKQIEQKQQDLN